MEKEKYPVLKGFFDTEDKLKTGEHKKGRHYTVVGDFDVYPATNREVNPDRLKFLQDEGFVGKEAIKEEE